MTPMMKAVRFISTENAAWMDVDCDAAAPGPAEVTACTLCSLVSPGTELNVYLGEYDRAQMGWGRFPMTPGYAAVARVQQVGGEVNDLQPGQLIFCAGPHQSLQRRERRQVVPLPAGLAPERALYARIINITFTTLCTTAVRPPETVLVVGLGLVGLLGAQLFALGGYRVVGVDPLESRRELARRCGIATVLPAAPVEDPAWRGRIGLVLDCSANEQAVVDATRCARRGGEVVLVGVPMSDQTGLLAVEAYKAVFRSCVTLRSGSEWQLPLYPERSGRPSWWGNIGCALQWLAEGRFAVDGLHTMARPERCQQVYQDLLHKRIGSLSVVFDWTNHDNPAEES
jgi:threonine dehydrogenase-like Zn-dependent dehydrogenase